MLHIIKYTACFCILIIVSSFQPPATVSCKETIEAALASIENIKSLKFHLKCAERISGKLVFTESQVKLNVSPRKIYIYLKGPELLWLEGKNNGNALVNPDGFPYMNLMLDPMGSVMRENQHHTIHEMGFEYFAGIIKHAMRLAGDHFDDYFKCVGSIVWEKRDCYFIMAEYSHYKYEEYTVEQGETLISIARKLHVSEYMLLEINGRKNYRDVKVGQKISVPNMYGKKLVLYIDKKLLIPAVIKVFDEKGLFESYEYHHLEVNPQISAEEFTKEYPGYRF